MKFIIESVGKCSGRLGTLTGIEKFPELSLKTPILLQTTKVSDITKDFHAVFLEILLFWIKFLIIRVEVFPICRGKL